jgi:ABC-2 type transport system permease protein
MTRQIFFFEAKHLVRNYYKVISLILFVLISLYSIHYGYNLYQTRLNETNKIVIESENNRNKIIQWFNDGIKGPEDRPWIDISNPFWALWNSNIWAFSEPSVLMALSVGQAENFPYYKKINVWATPYDADMVNEITNYERLALGSIDFSFVIIYLLPVLLIMLLYNIGGYEKDNRFYNLIKIQNSNSVLLLFKRSLFYLLLVNLIVLIILFAATLIIGATQNNITLMLSFFSYAALYSVLWFALFLVIILVSKNSSQQIIRMVVMWLVLCLIIPSTVSYYISSKFPFDYMSDFIETDRKKVYELYEIEPDSIKKLLVSAYPQIKNFQEYNNQQKLSELTGFSFRAVANELLKESYNKIIDIQTKRYAAAETSYPFNPVAFFSNTFYSLSKTDFLSQINFQKEISEKIDPMLLILVEDLWNAQKINKEKYSEYINQLK